MRKTGFKTKKGEAIHVGDTIRLCIEDSVEESGGYWWEAIVKEVKGCLVAQQKDFDYSESIFPDEFTFLYEIADDCEIVKSYKKEKLQKNKYKKIVKEIYEIKSFVFGVFVGMVLSFEIYVLIRYAFFPKI